MSVRGVMVRLCTIVRVPSPGRRTGRTLVDHVRPLEIDHALAFSIEPFGVPTRNAAIHMRLRFAQRDDFASRRERVAGINGAMKRELLDAEKCTTRFTQVFHGQTEYREENKHRVYHDTRVPVRGRVL